MNQSTTLQPSPPHVPDHKMLRIVGHGAAGEVWLARSLATGRYRAVKVVGGKQSQNARIYEVEFEGLRRFEEISREHEGFVDILHISRDDQAGRFAYVMELADDLEAGPQITEQVIERYCPKTVAHELEHRGKQLPPEQCVSIGLALADALIALHQRGLVHRDIKPGNVIFVRGAPKLADIGLIAEADREHTIEAGTPGYMDMEVHGYTAGDLYGLGKLLYVMVTGRKAVEWPAAPAKIDPEHAEAYSDLEAIFNKACATDRAQRYSNAQELRAALERVRVGLVRRVVRLEQLVAALKRYGLMALALVLVAVFGSWQWTLRREQTKELHQRRVGSYLAYGTRAVEENDPLGALTWLTEALRLDARRPEKERGHRLRLGWLLQHSPEIAQMWFQVPAQSPVVFAGSENNLLLRTAEGLWAVHDTASGRPLSPPFGSGSMVEFVSFSPPSDQAVTSVAALDVAAGAAPQQVQVWDLWRGEQKQTLSGPGLLRLGATSANGEWVAASLSNTFVVVWNLAGKTNALMRTLGSHDGHLEHLAFSPDSTRLLSSGRDRQTVLWDLRSGSPLVRFTNHKSWVYCAAFSPDGRAVASASFDRSVRVWDAQTGLEMAEPLWHGDGVQSVAFSHDGERVVSAGLDFSVRVWNWREGQLLYRLRHHSRPIFAEFSPSGLRVAAADYDGVVRLWNLERAHWRPTPRRAAVSENGARLAIVAEDGIEIHDADRNELQSRIRVSITDLTDLSMSGDGGVLLTLTRPANAGTGLLARLWDCRSRGAELAQVRLEPGVTNAVLGPHARHIIARAPDKVTILNATNGQLRFTAHPNAWVVSLNPLEDRIAVSHEMNLMVWNLKTGKPAWARPRLHHAPVQSIDWAPDGNSLVSGCWDKSLDPEAARVWDADTGELLVGPLAHRDGVRHAVFSPDGRKVLTSGEDFTSVLWSAKTGEQLIAPLRLLDAGFCGAFTADGQWLATGGRARNARVWDASSGEPLTPPLPHERMVVKVWFSAGAQRLLTQTDDGLVHSWPLPMERRSLSELKAIAELLSSQAFSGEGMRPHSRDSLQTLWQNLRRDAAQQAAADQ